MLDPVTAGFIGNLAADLGGRAIAAWSKALVEDFTDQEPSPALDGFYAVPDDNGQVAGVLSPRQLMEVKGFLESGEVAAVIQALFLARFLPSRQGEQAVENLRMAFEALANDWCARKGHEWASLWFEIWRQVTAFYASVMPNSAGLAEIPRGDLLRLRSYMGEPAELGGNDEPLPLFVRNLLEISKSSKRLSDIRAAANDLRRAYSLAFATMRLNHAQDNYRYTFEDLYISRTLQDRSSGETFASSEVLSAPPFRPRIVVVGDPGAGKSTLVEHLIYSMTRANSGTDLSTTPAILRCRDYAALSRSTPILHALMAQMASDMHHDLDLDALRDMLTLGRVTLVFDGIDEIVDLAYRRQVVDRVESLALRYPLSPILVTSRRIGYHTAPFDPKLFDVLDLVEFTEAQVAEYVDRWFKKSARSESDRDGFLRESTSLEDIRTNPLMLSLLCILYKARGYIPRNRREIYRECADLLFYRWDSMRKIEQPLDHRRYGHHLMQDLAHFFSRHEEAQAGIEEKQVRGLIATFFIDTAGVERYEATNRAAEFLDFCSNRAWLLTVKGVNDRGERLFGFTHRTFMEFYTAEAIVRNADSLVLHSEILNQ
jgi:GTPase SAR1 family protein